MAAWSPEALRRSNERRAVRAALAVKRDAALKALVAWADAGFGAYSVSTPTFSRVCDAARALRDAEREVEALTQGHCKACGREVGKP